MELLADHWLLLANASIFAAAVVWIVNGLKAPPADRRELLKVELGNQLSED
jgi:hypothetical protein